MYRGSTFLLQRDYKTHKKVVKHILNPMYEPLWNFNPNELNNNDLKRIYNLIFNEYTGIYFKIKNSYNENNDCKKVPTATLVTKILLGTFACLPAFDELLTDAITFCKEKGKYKDEFKDLSTNIEKYPEIVFNWLCNFTKKHKNELQIEYNNNNEYFNYPLMRCIDAYLWQIGFKIGESIKDKNSK